MKKLFLLALLPAFALAGCNGISKTEFAKFKEKAEKAVENAKEVDDVTYKGKYGDEKISFSTNQGIASYSVTEALVVASLGGLNKVTAFTGMEVDSYEYYTGLGFKVVTADAKVEYNGKGFLTKASGKLDGKEYNISVKQTFKK